mmetsp:Transcript_12709/g.23222  ORF Transcript_12709/g.23222 Transcript_12709/m.23222 type:complete len:81 (-) Transcript_12709:517-759(-)
MNREGKLGKLHSSLRIFHVDRIGKIHHQILRKKFLLGMTCMSSNQEQVRRFLLDKYRKAWSGRLRHWHSPSHNYRKFHLT